jgi:hypothetical protein
VVYVIRVLTGLVLRLKRSLPEADIKACLATVHRPIANLGSHPPWWSSCLRAVSKTSVSAVNHDHEARVDMNIWC